MDSPSAVGLTYRSPSVEDAEPVAFRISEHLERLVTGLADVCRWQP
jgi:hypothetical protein